MEEKKHNLQEENEQEVANQKASAKTQQPANDFRDQQIKNNGDNGRIRSESQSVKDAEKEQSRH